MVLQSVRRRLAVLSVLMLGAVGLVVVSPAESARASTISWSRPLSVQPEEIFTHGDGSVTLASRCSLNPSYTSHSVVVSNQAGVPSTRLAREVTGATPYFHACEGRGTAGSDGTVYATRFVTSGGLGLRGIVAYKNGVMRWPAPVSYDVCTTGSVRAGEPRWVTVGSDGDVYAILAGGCQTGNDRLIGITASTGAIKFNVQLTSNFINEPWYTRRLGAYSGGLVALDGKTVRHFSNTGVEDVSKQYTFSLTTGEYISVAEPSATGTMFISVYRSAGSTPADPCNANNVLSKRIVSRSASGVTTTFDLVPECVGAQWIRPTPDGGVTIQALEFASSSAPVAVLHYDSSATKVFRTTVSTRTGFSTIWSSSIQVDVNGVAYLHFSGVETSGDVDRHVWVKRISAAGVVDIIFSTEQFDVASTTEIYSYTTHTNGLGAGAYYIALCKGGCSGSALPTLYRVEVAGVAVDYPRGAILPVDTKLTYAAMADSYASGEGVEPYVEGTDVTTNRCHRALNAYPFLLEQDPATNLNLVDFSACSGATTQNVLTTSLWSEPRQIDALPGDVDVVTVQVGGNDIDFAGGITACAATSDNTVCENTLSVVKANAESVWFQERVQATFDAIEAKSPGQVIVIGYFNFMLNGDGITLCAWPLRAQTVTEAQHIYDIASALNSVLRLEALARGFTFIDMEDAFTGHSICDSTPWINGVDPVNEEHSFHPNTPGRSEVKELVKAAL